MPKRYTDDDGTGSEDHRQDTRIKLFTITGEIVLLPTIIIIDILTSVVYACMGYTGSRKPISPPYTSWVWVHFIHLALRPPLTASSEVFLDLPRSPPPPGSLHLLTQHPLSILSMFPNHLSCILRIDFLIKSTHLI